MTAPEFLEAGTNWTDVTTRFAFPILLRRAMDGDPITYGNLNDAAHAAGASSAMAIAYRYVAGKVGDICQALADDFGEYVPPLNAIIINQDTGLPSHGVDGYLATYFGMTNRQIARLSDDKRNDYARAAMEKVFNYIGWNRVAHHLGISEADLGKGIADRGDPIPLPDPRSFATGPESDAHKDLKAWVAANPNLFEEYGRFRRAGTEYGLASGDRLDVFFENTETQLAVEIKAKDALDGELQRGVYQCIKYRATLRAMQLANSRPPNAQAVLVLDRPPPLRVVQLAERLSVSVINVGNWR
jgi:hypothetical protein